MLDPLGGTDTIVAGSGDDTINLGVGDASSDDTFDGGLGNNTLNFTGGDNSSIDLTGAVISRIGNFTSGDQSQTVNMTAGQFIGFSSIGMGDGNDVLNVQVTGGFSFPFDTLPALAGVDNLSLSGSSSGDVIYIYGSQLDAFKQVDLGEGNDTIALRSTSNGLAVCRIRRFRTLITLPF